jgi:hypothetical protein
LQSTPWSGWSSQNLAKNIKAATDQARADAFENQSIVGYAFQPTNTNMLYIRQAGPRNAR